MLIKGRVRNKVELHQTSTNHSSHRSNLMRNFNIDHFSLRLPEWEINFRYKPKPRSWQSRYYIIQIPIICGVAKIRREEPLPRRSDESEKRIGDPLHATAWWQSGRL